MVSTQISGFRKKKILAALKRRRGAYFRADPSPMVLTQDPVYYGNRAVTSAPKILH